MVKDHSDSERGNPLPTHGLLFPIKSKGSFICTFPSTGYHIPRPLLYQSWSTGLNEFPQKTIQTHMVDDHSESERGNPLPLQGLLFPISSKGSFICIIPHHPTDRITHTMACVTPVVEHWLERV